jgi:hypothetical protein
LEPEELLRVVGGVQRRLSLAPPLVRW